MSLITLGLATDYLTEAGSDPTAPITISNRPFFWQQMERTRANFAETLDNLANIKHAQVTLNNTQIKALPTTPVTLITAPASGIEIVPLVARVKSVTTSGKYTNINENYSAVAIYWLGDFNTWALTGIVDDSSGSPRNLTMVTQMLGSADSTSTRLIPYHDSWVDSLIGAPCPATVDTEAKALAIACDNLASGNYTGGHASNSLRVDVLYIEV